jgi:hypothetical protein
VTPCAAYLKPLFSAPKTVVLPSGRSFQASEGGAIIAVSLHAVLYDFAGGHDANRGGKAAPSPAEHIRDDESGLGCVSYCPACDDVAKASKVTEDEVVRRACDELSRLCEDFGGGR